MQPLLVTCAINVKNGQDYIEEAISSIIAQTILAKIIIVDNASMDNTPLIINRCAQRFANIWTHSLSSPVLLGAARNVALSEVTTPYVAWLDCDDKWEPDFLADAVGVMQNHTRFIMASCGAIKIDKSGCLLPKSCQVWMAMEKEYLFQEGDTALEVLKNMKSCSPWSSYVFRTDVLKKMGGFNEKLAFAEDMDLILRALSYGKAAYIVKNNCYYRVHENQDTNTRDKNQIYAEHAYILNLQRDRKEMSLHLSFFRQLDLVNQFKINWSAYLKNHRLDSFFKAIGLLIIPAVWQWALRRIFYQFYRRIFSLFSPKRDAYSGSWSKWASTRIKSAGLSTEKEGQ